MYYIEQVKTQIIDSIKSAVSKITEFECAINLERPQNAAHGDFSANTAMVLAKSLKKSPRDIAGQIIANLPENALIDKVETAGAGFINFYLKPGFLAPVLTDIHKMDKAYGKAEKTGKKVMVEFISANPTGSMHMGNARGGAMGDCLASVLQWAGNDVTREFYINDAGAQIEKFGKSLACRYMQILEGEQAHPFPEDGYQGDDITEHARQYIEKFGDSLKAVEQQQRCNILSDYALKLNLIKMKSDLQRYGIEYDVWFSESSLYESGAVDQAVEMLKSSGKAYENEGALWLKCSEFGGEKDEVLIRANGIPTYFMADIAYHYNKFAVRGFDKVIDVWGADHHGHVARMKGALDMVGGYGDKLEILLIQLVRLVRGNEVVRMSKRTGKMITLTDLIEETSRDAARYFFNLRAAGTHMDFDLDLALEQSNDNPVFYVQYAHARICSILRNMQDVSLNCSADTSVLTAPQEYALICKLAEFPQEIRVAAAQIDPSRMTKYCSEVAALFHSFYAACRVKDSEYQDARLLLCDCTRIVLRNTLEILGISAPEKM